MFAGLVADADTMDKPPLSRADWLEAEYNNRAAVPDHPAIMARWKAAAEARRSLTKFLSTIIIALFLEALVLVFKTAREDVTQIGYPTALVVASVLVLVGLGVFQRMSATVEEKVGDDDEAEDDADRAEAGRPVRRRKAGTAKT